MKNLLDVLTADRGLPAGCDRWGIRTVHPDLRSRHGYRWPWPGQWAHAPGPIINGNGNEYPIEVGDGICLARTWATMALAGVPAVTLLLCAWSSADLLSSARGDRWRLRRAYVVDIADGARLVRDHGRDADLRGADLEGADLERADLRGANLRGANLRRVHMRGANLRGAVLRQAILQGAVLERADLQGADLQGADLERADLRGAVRS
ncbi:pentapeptide repeat-containing protein [Salinispora vitiensis]|uniref:pentapeptide repeat-containing protein n=1 Tax=Salinispora vitiensis TaxID=999544 RepID=UPI000360A3D8|nr:pentapeptide repeat-containing protein [Salinispora vitiensis]